MYPGRPSSVTQAEILTYQTCAHRCLSVYISHAYMFPGGFYVSVIKSKVLQKNDCIAATKIYTYIKQQK